MSRLLPDASRLPAAPQPALPQRTERRSATAEQRPRHEERAEPERQANGGEVEATDAHPEGDQDEADDGDEEKNARRAPAAHWASSRCGTAIGASSIRVRAGS